jgi:hypothetical protein
MYLHSDSRQPSISGTKTTSVEPKPTTLSKVLTRKCSLLLLKLVDGSLCAWVEELKPQSTQICHEIIKTAYKKLLKLQDNALRLTSKLYCNWEKIFQIALTVALSNLSESHEANDVLEKEVSQSKSQKEREILNILIGKYRYSQILAPIDAPSLCTPITAKRTSIPSTNDTRPSKKKRLMSSIGQLSEDNEKDSTTSSSQKSMKDEDDPITQIKKKTCTLFKGTSLNSNKFMFSLKKQKKRKVTPNLLMAFCGKAKKHSPLTKAKIAPPKMKKTPTEGAHRKSSLCEIIEFGTPQRGTAADSNLLKFVPCHDLSKVFEGMSK